MAPISFLGVFAQARNIRQKEEDTGKKPIPGLAVIYDPLGHFYQPIPGRTYKCINGHINRAEDLISVQGPITYIACPVCMDPDGCDLVDDAN